MRFVKCSVFSLGPDELDLEDLNLFEREVLSRVRTSIKWILTLVVSVTFCKRFHSPTCELAAEHLATLLHWVEAYPIKLLMYAFYKCIFSSLCNIYCVASAANLKPWLKQVFQA